MEGSVVVSLYPGSSSCSTVLPCTFIKVLMRCSVHLASTPPLLVPYRQRACLSVWADLLSAIQQDVLLRSVVTPQYASTAVRAVLLLLM